MRCRLSDSERIDGCEAVRLERSAVAPDRAGTAGKSGRSRSHRRRQPVVRERASVGAAVRSLLAAPARAHLIAVLDAGHDDRQFLRPQQIIGMAQDFRREGLRNEPVCEHSDDQNIDDADLARD